MKQLGNTILNEKFFSKKTMDSLEKSFQKRDEVEKIEATYDGSTATDIAEFVFDSGTYMAYGYPKGTPSLIALTVK